MVALHPSILGEEAVGSLLQRVALGSLEGDLPQGAKEGSWRISLGRWKLWDEQEEQMYRGVWGKVGDHPDRENSVCEALRQEGGWNVWSR